MPTPGGAQLLNVKEVLGKLEINEKMTVVDFGCGNLGYFIIPMAKLVGKDGLAIAIDIQKQVLEAVKSKAKLMGLTNVQYVWANLEKVGSTKIADNVADVVVMVNMLFQNKKHQEILQEAKRILKPDGKFLVVDWKKIGVPFGPPVESRIDARQIKVAAEDVGLDVVEDLDFNYFWGVIFKK